MDLGWSITFGQQEQKECFYAENVVLQMEGIDLPTTVAQQLIGAHRAGHDLVEIFRRFALCEQFLALVETQDNTLRLVTLSG